MQMEKGHLIISFFANFAGDFLFLEPFAKVVFK